MSGRPAPTSPVPAADRFTKSLEEPSELSELVRHLLEMRREDAFQLLRGTTSTAFRRVHEHVTSAIDRAAEILATVQAGDRLDDRGRNEIVLLFTRGYILVSYQEARGQLSRELAERVKVMMDRVLSELKVGRMDVGKLKSMLDSMRTLMDAMAVLIYRHAKK